MSSLVGKVYEFRKNKNHYMVYKSDGFNPPVPTNTPCAYLKLIDKPRILQLSQPQEFIQVPLEFLDQFFTDRLTRRPVDVQVKDLV